MKINVSKDVFLDLKDLLAEYVRRIWIILVGMIIFAVAIAGLKYYEEFREAKANQELAKQELLALQESNVTLTNSEIEDMLSDLSEDEVELVEDYVELEKSVMEQEKYYGESDYMNLNPYNITVHNLQYHILAANEQETRDLAVALRTFIVSGGLASNIAEKDESINAAYVQETFIVYGMDYTAEMPFSVIDLKIYASDSERAQLLVGYIKEEVEAFSTSFKESNYENQIQLVYETENQFLDRTVEQTQTTYRKELEDNKKARDTAYAALSEDLQELADQIVLGYEEFQEEPDEMVTQALEEKANQEIKVSISKKFLVLGGFVGFICFITIITLIYCFDEKIKTSDEVERQFKITNLGCVLSQKKKTWNAWVDRIFYKDRAKYEDSQQDLLVHRIVTSAKNAGVKELAIVGELYPAQEDVLKEIIQKVAKSGIKLEYIGNLRGDILAVHRMEETSKVILVETIRRSNVENIREEVLLCQEAQEVELIGYFTFAS